VGFYGLILILTQFARSKSR